MRFNFLFLLLLPWYPSGAGAPFPAEVAAVVSAKRASPWDSAAEAGQAALLKHFWSSRQHYFYQDNAGKHQFNYWWQAHAIDVLLDGYERSKNKQYLDLVRDLHAGVAANNGGTYLNEYYDDMEWMALACLRAFALTGEARYKQTALLLWQDIKTGWSGEFGGGISWKKTQRSYKNTPANAPAVILAARLYQLDKNRAHLEWAQKIYAWEKQHLVDPQTGLVWDGFNRQGNGQIDKNWKFSYNQGVYIGAGLELFKATRQRHYLQEAVRTATYVTGSPDFLPGGIFKSEGGGDGGLFKGIFIRYLTQLMLEGKLSKKEQARLQEVLENNGTALLRQGADRSTGLFGMSPLRPPGAATDASVQLSGLMLLEALAKLQRHQ